MSILTRLFDERFLAHRQRSTSTAGITAALVSIVMFEYRLLAEHTWRWDLLSIGLTFAVVKMSLMAWYTIRD